MIYLLDTNAVIAILRDQPVAVRTRLRRVAPKAPLSPRTCRSSVECAGSYGRIGPPKGDAETIIRAAADRA